MPNSKKMASLYKEPSFFGIDPEIVQVISLSANVCNLLESEEETNEVIYNYNGHSSFIVSLFRRIVPARNYSGGYQRRFPPHRSL